LKAVLAGPFGRELNDDLFALRTRARTTWRHAFTYSWPFEVGEVARFLATQIERFA
jgi:hypothetical protein